MLKFLFKYEGDSMGKQYKALKEKDIKFIKEQKLFYLASSSGDEVNLSPKGYDSIRVMDESTIVFMSYVGSGNRTYTDAINGGEFTLLFNAFEGKAKILRIFAYAEAIESDDELFEEYCELFSEKASLVRNFFVFSIYAVESSCGESVPYMEYKGERAELKEWMVKMDNKGKLEEYKENHFNPPDLSWLK
jgi:hypothetical protein